MLDTDITLRPYIPSDYPSLKKVYETAGWFDQETDAEEKLAKQIEKDKESILLVTDGDTIVGTVTLLFTGRLGLFFRLIASSAKIQKQLLQRGEQIFKEYGYNEVHIIAPEENASLHSEYEQYGFQKGRVYLWFWKKIEEKPQ